MEKAINHNGGLVLGFLVGGAVGIVAGLVFASKSGKELRSDIRETGTKVYEEAKQMISDAEAKAKSAIDEGKGKVQKLRKEAEDRLSDARAKACRALNCEVKTGAEA